jgi:hypothetical protein
VEESVILLSNEANAFVIDGLGVNLQIIGVYWR